MQFSENYGIGCIIRSPRISHCSVCNSCFIKYDHHCPWLGTCIAKRNYKTYYFFLLHLALLGAFDFITAVNDVINCSLSDTLQTSWCSILTIPFSLFTFIFSGKLFISHTGMILQNKTSKEVAYKLYQSSLANPYNKRLCYNNCIDAFRHGKSKLGYCPKASQIVYPVDDGMKDIVPIVVPQSTSNRETEECIKSNREEVKIEEIQKTALEELDKRR
eukprot:TRINITY_DN4164_c0_g1_i3.p1 TRINITY_DN4164_c0_g1~~TRINITY_DN4164_c0_g1_i3.p1  ORF type:complete len:217 (+),score=21.72 TRINITY_DN4164_c0_g1_i3:401-1051(+)